MSIFNRVTNTGGARQAFLAITNEVRALNTDKGWRNLDVRFAEHMALLHSEVSEALDAFRTRGGYEYTDPDTGKPEDVGSELADTLIRLFDICDIFGIDLLAEYERKMDYNWTRPHLHGGKTL